MPLVPAHEAATAEHRQREKEKEVSRLKKDLEKLKDSLKNTPEPQKPQVNDNIKAAEEAFADFLKDLKRHGMLEETLVVSTTEFGRTPGVDGTKGRSHHSACFSSWLAGCGVKGRMTWGATDDIASTVAENKVHVHDFHATILHLMGMDHEKLTYRHGGRDYRLTDAAGNVVRDLIA